MSLYQDFEDPKIILTASLLRQRDMIVGQINVGDACDAFKAMATLVTQFCIDSSEKELIKAKNELVENTITPVLPAGKVMHYWEMINNYMNKTYFADFHRAKPKIPKEGHI